MIIYCNGDSFVAGVELGDDLIPDHPGYLDMASEPSRAMQSWTEHTHDSNHAYGKIRIDSKAELFELDRQRAFPDKLNALLNVPVINHALGGSSMDRIVRTTMTELIEYKNNNVDVVAIIGLTHYDRSEVPNFNDNGLTDYLGYPNHWINLSLGYRNSDLMELDAIRDYKIHHEKTYHSMFSLYKNIILLQDFCKVNDIPLFWVLPHESDITDNIEPTHQSARDFVNLKQYANFKCEIDMTAIAKEINIGVRCPAGHFSEIVHDEVARRLASILQENNYV